MVHACHDASTRLALLMFNMHQSWKASKYKSIRTHWCSELPQHVDIYLNSYALMYLIRSSFKVLVYTMYPFMLMTLEFFVSLHADDICACFPAHAF